MEKSFRDRIVLKSVEVILSTPEKVLTNTAFATIRVEVEKDLSDSEKRRFANEISDVKKNAPLLIKHINESVTEGFEVELDPVILSIDFKKWEDSVVKGKLMSSIEQELSLSANNVGRNQCLNEVKTEISRIIDQCNSAAFKKGSKISYDSHKLTLLLDALSQTHNAGGLKSVLSDFIKYIESLNALIKENDSSIYSALTNWYIYSYIGNKIVKNSFGIFQYISLVKESCEKYSEKDILSTLTFTLQAISAYSKSKGVELPSSLAAVVSCHSCGEKVNSGYICEKCGVYIKCPGCSKPISKGAVTCAGCGVSVEKIPDYIKLLSEAQRKVDSGIISGVESSLSDFAINWAKYDSVIKLKEKISSVKTEIADQERKLDENIRKLQFVAARQIVQRLLEKNRSPLLEQKESEIKAKISAADNFVSQASATSNWINKIDLFKRALNICVDLREADTGLSCVEIKPPADFSADVIGRTVRLIWNKENSDHISYTVVRKINGIPKSHNDGEVLATVADRKFDDTKTDPGVSYYYSVFSKCDNKYSKTGASSDPVTTVRDIDIKTLKYDIQEHHISFNYNLPPNVKEVEICRDNTIIRTVTGSNFLDSGLIPDKMYTYRFVAVFEDCKGDKHRSDGITISLKPTSPPQSISLGVKATEDKVILSWSAPSKGILEIYSSDKYPFTENVNDIINKDNFKGDKIITSGNSYTVNKDFTGIKYYLPVTVSDNIGVAGAQVTVISILKPEGVAFDRISDRSVEVCWLWSRGVESVKISYRIDGGKDISDTVSKTDNIVPKRVITLPKGSKDITIGVQTCVTDSKGNILLSDMVSKTIIFRVAKISFLDAAGGGFLSRSKYRITIQTDCPLPCDLHLLIGEGHTPINLNNYKSYLTVSNKDINVGKPCIINLSYNRNDKSKPLIFRLVPSESSMFKDMVITPETKQVK